MATKQFKIGMLIEALDRVTGPAKKVTASIRKMAVDSEEAIRISNKRSAKHTEEHVKKHGEAHGKHHGGFFHTGFEKVFEAIPEVAAVAGLIGGIEGVAEGYKKVTEASDAAETSQLRLKTLMMHVKGTTLEQVKGITELAEKLEGKSTFAHTIFESAGSELAGFGMKAIQIKALLPSLSDYLAKQKGIHATTEDGIAAAKLFGKAYTGNVGALRRSGIVFTKAQEAVLKHGTALQRTGVIIQGIQGKFGGYAAKLAATTEGKVAALGNTWEGVKEKMGDSLKPLREGVVNVLAGWMPGIRRFADALPRLFSQGGSAMRAAGQMLSHYFNKGFTGVNMGEIRKSFASWAPLLQSFVAPLKRLGIEIVGFLAKAGGQLMKWTTELWLKSQPGLKAFAEGFKPLITAVEHFWKQVVVPLWDSVLAPLFGWLMTTAAPFLINVLGPAFKLMGEMILSVTDLQIKLWKGLFQAFGQIGKAYDGFYPKLLKKLQDTFTDLGMKVGKIWRDMWNGMFGWLIDNPLFKALLANIGTIANAFGYGGNTAPAAAGGGGGGGGRSQPPRLVGDWRKGSSGLDAFVPGVAGPNGKIQLEVSHAPELKVKVKSQSGLDKVYHGAMGGY